ncbi:MAG: helix-turn-helix domain-containing protein [Lachnospiraceae bacterium]|nr:helix-turn-helix domain-containing protein [Lachnospiraceae bacterium]
MDNLNFAQNLTMLRHKHGITQEALADFIGVTKASVSKWETGQSVPDIQTLFLLAAYYDVTLDELLDYRPILTKKQIRSLYHELAKDFAKKPFEEVFARSQGLVKNYYSCYGFLIQVAVLWLNHFMLAAPERQGEVLEEILKLCARIYGKSGDNGLCSDAIVIEAIVKLQQGKSREVIATLEEICNPYRFAKKADSLLFQAYMQSGNVIKADASSQIYYLESVLALVDSMINYLIVHTKELEKCEILIAQADSLLEQDGIEELIRNMAAQFHYRAAVVYCMHGKGKEAAARLRHFVRIVKQMKQTKMRLCGNVLFDRLEEWFEENELGAEAVRDSAVVMESAKGALDAPVFSCLMQGELEAIKAELDSD